MCSATVGATPVNACTWAASAIFSHGVRGTPGCGKTLNLVPELPNAQDGSSMRCARSAALIVSRSAISLVLHQLVRELRVAVVRGRGLGVGPTLPPRRAGAGPPSRAT